MRRGRVGLEGPRRKLGGACRRDPQSAPGADAAPWLKAYHVAYTAERIITHALVTQLAYLVRSGGRVGRCRHHVSMTAIAMVQATATATMNHTSRFVWASMRGPPWTKSGPSHGE
jgi:hypothetical protein